MFKKIVLVFTAVAIIGIVAVAAAPAAKKSKTFVTPNATEMNLKSCRFAQEESSAAHFDATRLQQTEGYDVLLENDLYSVFYNDEICNARVLDKQSGYMWGSLTDGDRESLNDQWSQMADSLVTITYLNNDCMSAQSSISSPDFDVKYTVEGNKALFTASNSRIGISFQFYIILNEDSLQIKMAEASLEENSEYLLEALYFMPFFGAVKENEIDGYMFVPDGPGALIRYAESTKYIAPYSSRVYGNDMAVDELKRLNNLMAKRPNDYLTDQAQVTVPVFGVSHGNNKNAFLAVIDGGENYAYINASPAGFVTDFNYVTAKFKFRNTYQLSTGTGGGGITVNQESPNNCLPSVSYYFLCDKDADYSGMANTYRELLIKDGILDLSERIDSDIPLRVDVIGGDIKNGRLFDKYIPFTTVEQAGNICKTLTAEEIKNITFVYKGWTSGGLNGADYDETSLSSKLGNIEALTELKKYISDNGGRLLLAANPVTANKDQINYKKDGILTMSKTTAYFQRDNSKVAYPLTYIVKPDLAVDIIKGYLSKYSGFGLNFNEVGTRVYGDYARNRVIVRDKTAYMFGKTLSKAKQTIALNNPNNYMWNVTDEYFDLPLENSQYIYETDTVPFLSMVLKGSIDYYTPYINQGYYTTDYILKMIEYGAYPSFLVIAEGNEKLSGTPSEDYFSLCFDDWHTSISETYLKMNEVLKATEGMYITNHTVVERGLVKVDYSGGISILINYNDDQRIYDGVTVSAKQCVIVKEKH